MKMDYNYAMFAMPAFFMTASLLWARREAAKRLRESHPSPAGPVVAIQWLGTVMSVLALLFLGQLCRPDFSPPGTSFSALVVRYALPVYFLVLGHQLAVFRLAAKVGMIRSPFRRLARYLVFVWAGAVSTPLCVAAWKLGASIWIPGAVCTAGIVACVLWLLEEKRASPVPQPPQLTSTP